MNYTTICNRVVETISDPKERWELFCQIAEVRRNPQEEEDNLWNDTDFYKEDKVLARITLLLINILYHFQDHNINLLLGGIY